MTYFKVLSHDYRPPVQMGNPVWDGATLPSVLPKTKLDKSNAECAAGWNFTDNLATALRIGGLWKSGRPSCCLTVEPSKDAVTRGDKMRCSQLTITGRVPMEEVRAAIRDLSEPFGVHADRMADSQFEWFQALARERRNVRDVQRGLKTALKTRGLEDWDLRQYDAAWAARAAWDARDARAAWDARDARAAWAARDARDARDAWAAWDVRDVRAAWAAWDARDARAAWAARDAWAAWAARDALTVEYAALNEWTPDDPLLLTAGIRDAYAAGLEVVVPVDVKTLGWALRA